MTTPSLYHNPRCSKSRQALTLLQEQDLEFEVIEYLKAPPTKAQLKRIIDTLVDPLEDIVRFNEAEFKQSGLDKANLTSKNVIDAIATYPKLLQRPLLSCNDKTIIGRPPERIMEII